MGSIPITKHLSIPSGDDQNFNAILKNADLVTDYDLSTWVVIFTVKETKDEYTTDSAAVYQLKSTDASPRITISASGSPLVTTIDVNHFARESALNTSTPLQNKTYFYDLQLVSPAGVIHTWYRGKYQVTWHSSVAVS